MRLDLHCAIMLTLILDHSVPAGRCGCQDWHGCIMRPSVIGEEGIQPYKFSGCSMEQFQQWMGEGHALCLLNKPNQLADFGSCGNGVIDDGEECDCGSPERCAQVDPCCHPVTCRLKQESECSEGPCCDRCKVRTTIRKPLPRLYNCATMFTVPSVWCDMSRGAQRVRPERGVQRLQQ